MTTPTDGPLDAGTTEGETPLVPTVAEFLTYVGADERDEAVAARDLEEAVAHVDDFIGTDPMRPIPDPIRHKWYLQVGAEIFDSSNGPSASTDRFGNPSTVRSSRDPLHVVMREMRRYVGYF